MSLNQEHIATLRQEIPMIARQIQLISGPEFANTVPEVAVAKQALEQYKQAAEAHVAEWDSDCWCESGTDCVDCTEPGGCCAPPGAPGSPGSGLI